MSDDLNVLITVYDAGALYKIALLIPHGLTEFTDWDRYWKIEISDKWNSYLSQLTLAGCEIVAIEEILYVKEMVD